MRVTQRLGLVILVTVAPILAQRIDEGISNWPALAVLLVHFAGVALFMVDVWQE